ncbi:hypothetical protein EQG68_11855 [Flavobacterium piscinae]|uniref:Lipoprotein n=1 Tax=Flavobacterium piscinae TaxID=2506424 RepID=A0A4Q1KK77_9FLAO|nr:hypothetical protein [Flavobacterium piscinae]RXR30117.1 hypothetical protein EQG68_11855 [Flavobacterium piscinae]
MKTFLFFITLSITLLFSCKENTKNENEESLVNENALESLVEVTSGYATFEEAFHKLPLKSVPIQAIISKNEKILTGINPVAFSLPSIYELWFNKNYNYQLISGYRLNLSNDFYTAILKIKIGEIDQEHLLINYDFDGKIIDSILVAIFSDGEYEYSTTKSTINQNEILITSNFFVKDADDSEEMQRIIKILPDGKLKEISEKESILDFVAKELNIENPKRIKDLEAFKLQPNNPKEAIVVIPEIMEGSKEEEFFRLNSHIAIVNLKSKTITHQYFESHKTNGWVSDAIRLDEIKIDTAPYFVNESTRAFGIRVSYFGSSRVNPYYNQTLSLFIKENNTLKKILHNFNIEKNTGEWNGNCEGEFFNESKTLVISKKKTNGYVDILVKHKLAKSIAFLNQNDECDEKDTISNSSSILRFDGQLYN